MTIDPGFSSSLWPVEGGQGKKFERVAILGIGNELNGDDAAGVIAARELNRMIREREPIQDSRSPAFLIIEAGTAPEAFTGPLRRFLPDLVILIDAAELGEPPGTVHRFDWSSVDGLSASTHTLPPSVLAQYLIRELDCQVMLIGIQPLHLDFDRPVSGEVQQAVARVVQEFESWIKQ